MRRGHLHLTPIDFSVYEFIVKYKQTHGGNSPSVLEICRACGISSTSMVRVHLDKLILFGMVTVDYGEHRSRMISIPGARWIPPSLSESSSPITRADRGTLSVSSPKA